MEEATDVGFLTVDAAPVSLPEEEVVGARVLAVAVVVVVGRAVELVADGRVAPASEAREEAAVRSRGGLKGVVVGRELTEERLGAALAAELVVDGAIVERRSLVDVGLAAGALVDAVPMVDVRAVRLLTSSPDVADAS